MDEDGTSDRDDEMAQCEICGKTFFYEAILNIHIRKMHGNGLVPEIPEAS